jgi:hypothetical protein
MCLNVRVEEVLGGLWKTHQFRGLRPLRRSPAARCGDSALLCTICWATEPDGQLCGCACGAARALSHALAHLVKR